MKHIYIIPLILFIYGCISHSKEIEKLNFPFKKDYEAVYFTKSTLYREDGSERFKDSTNLHLKINKIKSEKGNKVYEWLMLPGMKNKSIPDTMLSQFDQSGYYIYFSPDFLPGAEKETKLIQLPLKTGSSWQSSYLSFPAKAAFLEKDSTIKCPAGEFKTFAIQYEFLPFYMEEFVPNPEKDEAQGVLIDYYSLDHGKILSQIDYYIVEKKTGKRKWKILSNQSILHSLTIPK